MPKATATHSDITGDCDFCNREQVIVREFKTKTSKDGMYPQEYMIWKSCTHCCIEDTLVSYHAGIQAMLAER